MNKDNEIVLEPFFNEKGILTVRCKETKRAVSNLQKVEVRGHVREGYSQNLDISVRLVPDET